jgi:glycosyltransferase involved in cell wall biosynthesis
MRIAIDARTVYNACRRGTGKTLIDLYRWMAKIRPGWRFLMFRRNQESDDPFTGLPNVENRVIEVKGDRLNLWEQFRLPWAAWTARCNVLHCPANTAPCHPLAPMVLTVHDLIPLETAPEAPETRLWERRVRTAVRKARHVLTPSAYSKRQLIGRLDVPQEKVTVNPWAPDSKLRRVTDAGELSRVRRKYGLSPNEPYVFGFGADDPRKNTRRQIEAWKALPSSLQNHYVLLLVGIQEPALSRFREQVNGEPKTGRILLHGFAHEDDLSALLSGSTALSYPSLSEGFGLPVLDAFACETAVLTSSTTSLPEVAGEAAVLVDPTDARSIRDGLMRLLGDEEFRGGLIARGRERLHSFTWEYCAERAAQVLEQVALSRASR